MQIRLYNTQSRSKEEFEPRKKGEVSMYNCGPTVYGLQHIGNLSMFVFTDILRRTLEYAGFKVKQVINITDFGHLTGDNEGNPDIGEDRMTKGLKNEGLSPTLPNMRILAEKYAGIFFEHLKLLNINTENTKFPFASDYIKDQIKLIQKLEDKGFVYAQTDGMYFDTSKFANYGKLGDINLAGLKEGTRVAKSNKKNPTDFILWKADKKLGWESPWGLGFPGWHIECSAMIIKLLGEQIDIHTGGIEHIPVHHNNEIAQSEAATGKAPFAKFWLHRAHLKVDDQKIAKSSGTAIYMEDLITHQIHPLAFRYWLLTSHYQTGANFTWEGVLGAQNAFERVLVEFTEFPKTNISDNDILKKFEEAISDNLNTPIAIALLQEAKSRSVIEKIDKVLGLNIKELAKKLSSNIPDEITDLKHERDEARATKDWGKSDRLREEIEKEGYVLEDRDGKSKIRKTLERLLIK